MYISQPAFKPVAGSGISISGSTIATSPALTTLAPLASPTFTGTVTVPAPAASSNTTVAATTAFVVANLSGIPSIYTLCGGL